MSACHGVLVKAIVLIAILFRYQCNCYEISSKDPKMILPSHQVDSSPRDAANYHHYRKSDQRQPYTTSQREIVLNAIPHSQKYQGWRPIVSSRRSQTPDEKYSQYSSSKVVESNTVVSEANAKTDTTINEQPSKAPIQHAKYNTLKEDDIMWMHYGSANQHANRGERLGSPAEAKIINSVNEANVESKKQFHSQYRLDHWTRQNPRNIYEIMDGNSPPTFKPIAQSTQYSSSWGHNFNKSQPVDKGASREAHNSNAVINNKSQTEIEKGPDDIGIYDIENNEELVKVDPSRYHTQVDSDNTTEGIEPTEETSVENKYDLGSWISSYFGKPSFSQKGGKFLGKPIVIAEPAEPLPYFTAEYYRKLLDSFGRQERSFDNTLPNQTSTMAGNRIDTDIKSEHTSSNCTFNQANCNHKVDSEHAYRPPHRHRHRHRFNIFKFMGIDMNDLMPKTLRSNIYLIKKLLVQCYTELQDQDPSPIVCLKKITAKVLDNAIEKDIIKLSDSVSLVKENVTAITEFESSRSSSASTDWLSSIVDKMSGLFLTHSLRVKLVNSQEDHKYQIEGRRRHYFRRVFPVLAGIYLLITAVMIPIVFQFMAMMGGKSFVISKIALIFAVLTSVSKFLGGGEQPQPHHHHHSPPPSYYPHPPPPPPPETPTYYEHPQHWKKSDKRIKRVPINYSYYTVE